MSLHADDLKSEDSHEGHSAWNHGKSSFIDLILDWIIDDVTFLRLMGLVAPLCVFSLNVLEYPDSSWCWAVSAHAQVSSTYGVSSSHLPHEVRPQIHFQMLSGLCNLFSDPHFVHATSNPDPDAICCCLWNNSIGTNRDHTRWLKYPVHDSDEYGNGHNSLHFLAQ